MAAGCHPFAHLTKNGYPNPAISIGRNADLANGTRSDDRDRGNNPRCAVLDEWSEGKVLGERDEERLFAENLHDQFAPTRTCIEIDHDNLLPRSQQECSIRKWNDDRWTLELAPEMAVPVIFSGIAHVVLQGRLRGN